VNKSLLIALAAAIVLVVGAIGALVLFMPSYEEQKTQLLSGAVREGQPEFETLTKRIVTETNEDETWFSPVGTGTVMMSIAGRIKNNSDKSLTGLEVRVSVLDLAGKVVRENTVTIIPTQQAKLEPKKQMNVRVQVEGFKPDDDRASIRWKVTAIKTE
jgi:hypothetical protein